MGTLGPDFPNVEAVEQALKDGKLSVNRLNEVYNNLDDLQTQINNLVLEASESGDVSYEVAQARVDSDGVSHTTLKDRLDTERNSLKASNKVINSDTVEEICEGNFDNLPLGEIFSVSSGVEIVNSPDASGGLIMTLSRSNEGLPNGTCQIYFSASNKLYYREYWNTSWQEWKSSVTTDNLLSREMLYVIGSDTAINETNVSEICNSDANNLPNNRLYSVGLTSDVTNFPDRTGFIATLGRSASRYNGDIQIFVNSNNVMYIRNYWTNAWGAWNTVATQSALNTAISNSLTSTATNITSDNMSDICNSDMDNLPVNKVYGVATNLSAANMPTSLGGIVYTLGKSSSLANGTMQVYIDSAGKQYWRMYWSNTWGAWNTVAYNLNNVYQGSSQNLSDTTVSEICDSDANNLPNNRIYGVGIVSASVVNFPDVKGHIRTFGKQKERTSGDTQVFVSFTGLVYSRIYWGGSWLPWEGVVKPLKILAVGDSICYGGRNNNKGFVGDIGLPYNNSGISGATLSNQVTDVKNIPNQLVDVSGYDPDVIISNGGVNDYYFSAPLGIVPTTPVTTDTDANALDRSTVMGGLQYLLYKMVSLYPKAQRFFLLTHKTTAKASSTDSTIVDWTVTTNSAGYTQRQLFDAIKTTCEIYGVQVIDVFGKSMINTAFSQYKSTTPYSIDHSVTNTEFVDSDGIHPLAYGYKRGYVPLVKQALQSAVLR